MSPRRSARLDMNDAFLDLARHLGQPDSTQAGRSQDVNSSPQQHLQVLDHLHELQANGTLELDDQIDIAGFLGGLSRKGAEQSDSPDPELGGELGVALPQEAEDGLLSQVARWGWVGSHGGLLG